MPLIRPVSNAGPWTTRRLQALGRRSVLCWVRPRPGAGQLDKPRESQPEGGRRFTSQTGQHQHETLDQQQQRTRPARLIQVGDSGRQARKTPAIWWCHPRHADERL